MKLYYLPGACSLATHILLEWIGNPYETRKLSRDELKSDEYLEINPAGAVPALDVDGWFLTQNTAILSWLADSFPETALGGDGTEKSRAEINRWLGFLNSDMHPAFKPLFGTTAYLEDEAIIEQTKQHARKTLRKLFERVDRQLADKDWLVGSRSIADPYLFVMLRWAESTAVDVANLDNLARFGERMREDPGVARALRDEGLS